MIEPKNDMYVCTKFCLDSIYVRAHKCWAPNENGQKTENPNGLGLQKDA